MLYVCYGLICLYILLLQVQHYFPENLAFDDYVEICKKEKATTADDLMKAFRKIDINGDGYISLEELYKIMTTVSSSHSLSPIM